MENRDMKFLIELYDFKRNTVSRQGHRDTKEPTCKYNLGGIFVSFAPRYNLTLTL